WTTIESDPGVFTELLDRMGVKGVQMEELWSLDDDSLNSLQPIYGLIFLFKWQKEEDERPVATDYEERGVFFASQVIHNACATQARRCPCSRRSFRSPAIVSVLMNRPELEIGPELSQLREFTRGFPPDMKGLAIGNSETIRSVHNSFSPPQPILPPEERDDDKGEAFHFIAYVPVGGCLYELDGLKEGPIKLADCSEGDWLTKAAAAITARIRRYAASEVKFNLMACIEDRRQKHQRELAQQRRLQVRLRGPHSAATQRSWDGAAGLAGQAGMPARSLACPRLQAQLAMEEERRGRWRDENVRRRTDYIPFAFQLLSALAERGQLQPLVQKAQ
ncbi:hypothetical protein CHLNCDRAFT_10119, partial [Chlorella variabilis]